MWPVYFLQNEYKGVSEGSITLMYVEHENECYFLYVLCSQSQFQHAVMMVHQEVAGHAVGFIFILWVVILVNREWSNGCAERTHRQCGM